MTASTLRHQFPARVRPKSSAPTSTDGLRKGYFGLELCDFLGAAPSSRTMAGSDRSCRTHGVV